MCRKHTGAAKRQTGSWHGNPSLLNQEPRCRQIVIVNAKTTYVRGILEQASLSFVGHRRLLGPAVEMEYGAKQSFQFAPVEEELPLTALFRKCLE